LLKAVRHHTNCAWVLLYIERSPDDRVGQARTCDDWSN
jgi:hypothetical protein